MINQDRLLQSRPVFYMNFSLRFLIKVTELVLPKDYQDWSSFSSLSLDQQWTQDLDWIGMDPGPTLDWIGFGTYTGLGWTQGLYKFGMDPLSALLL